MNPPQRALTAVVFGLGLFGLSQVATLGRQDSGRQSAPIDSRDQAAALRQKAALLQGSDVLTTAIPVGTVIPLGTMPPPPPPPPPPGVASSAEVRWVYAQIRIGNDAAATSELANFVRPIYAPIAIAAGITGDVVLDASVNRAGRVAELKVVQSMPLLTQATVDAIRQWRFDPDAAQLPRTVRVTATFTPPSLPR